MSRSPYRGGEAPSLAGRARRPHRGARKEADLPRPLSASRWGELASLAADPSVAPALRRAAERQLLGRLGDLSRGERVSLARRATRTVLHAIVSGERDPAVMRAALGNPRMTEPDVLRVILDPRTRPEVLDAIGSNPGWSAHHAVRLALARNARTPFRTALRAVSGLSRDALLALAHDPFAPRLVRVGAHRRIDADAERLELLDRE